MLRNASTDGDDAIVGFRNNDVMRGGVGNDQLNGMVGNDAYRYARGDGHDTITESTQSGNDDRLIFDDVNPEDVTLVRDRSHLTIVVAESAPGAGDAGSCGW